MTTEQNKTTCKVCQQIKDKLHVGFYNNGDKKFANNLGDLWNGRVCPECHRDKQMNLQRKKRGSKN